MAFDYNLSIFFLGLACVLTLVGILGTIFWIWMIIDCATHEPSEGNDKVLWLLIIVLTHLVGALIYYFVRRPQRRSTVGR